MEDAAPYKEFIREMTLRIERAMRDFGGGMDEFKREMRQMRTENRAYFELVVGELRELRDESRAHTQALMRMLDRLEGGGAAPA